MCAPDMPTPPDPKETAAAQTGTNVSTAVANAALGNVNEYTPEGSKITKQTGTQSFYDPTTQKTYNVPTYSTYQTLSAAQQGIYDQKTKASQGMGELANTAIGQVKNLFNTPFDTSKLPKAGNAANIQTPQYQQFGAGPQMQTQLPSVGAIQSGYNRGGNIQSNIGKTAGQVQYKVPGADDFSADRQKYEDALMSRMNPQIQQDRQLLEQQLVNQGLAPGSEAYNRAIDSATRQANDARFGAILNAGEEQQRMFGMGLASGQFNNAAQAQDFSQQAARGQFSNAAQEQQNAQNQALAAFGNAAQNQDYNQDMGRAGLFNQSQQQMADNAYRRTAGNNQIADQRFNAQTGIFNAMNTQRGLAMQEATDARSRPLNEITALMAGTQVSRPTYVGANMPTLPTVDYAGLQQQNYANQMGQWQAQNANSQNMIGGIGGLFGSVLAMSDRRLKKNIEEVGYYKDHRIYDFDYDRDAGVILPEGRFRGVMADEVEHIPGAVVETAGGFKMVDYSVLGFAMERVDG